MMKRVPAVILLVCIAVAAFLPAATADDYVDDVYFVSAQKQAAKPAKGKQTTDNAAKSSAKSQTAPSATGAAPQSATAGTEKVHFVQVSDTVVKAVIRR